ncbi:hypothetical protein GOBAR_DD28709 [Gossypium barbadense]|nr:hypothetical protein GOBAR_DD28709 [Gossypium barbadense]
MLGDSCTRRAQHWVPCWKMAKLRTGLTLALPIIANRLTLRLMLAQNREAARKSRLRTKAYVQQLESSRLRLTELEQELQRARQQGIFIASGLSGDHGHTVAGNAALAFDMEYEDIHAVNMREMIFIMIYVSFDMILGAYLISNMTALIVKGSKTEKFRDKMAEVIKYMNRNKLERDLRNQIKGHLRLQYESTYTEAAVLQDIPISIRAKISQSLYFPYIENASLFKECSSEFINQIIIRLHEEFFLPGEAIMEQGNVVDQLYFVCHGVLEGKESNLRVRQLELDISFHIRRQEAELALRMNGAAYNGDFYQLKSLIRAGADPNKTDCDGRSPLHLAASKGYEDITSFLIRHPVDINLKDNYLCTAVAKGDSNFLRRLLSNGVDPNSRGYDHRTPLLVAASEGLYIMVKLW